MLEHMAITPKLHRHEVSTLEDNLAWAAVAAKGRSSSGDLTLLRRRRRALQVAAEVRQVLPWVETARQPADGLSRMKS